MFMILIKAFKAYNFKMLPYLEPQVFPELSTWSLPIGHERSDLASLKGLFHEQSFTII